MTYLRLANRHNDFFTNQLVDQLFRETSNGFNQEKRDNGQTRPQLNIMEMEKEFVLEMAIPGFSKEEVSVQVEKDLLKVKGEKEEKKENPNYKRREFVVADFEKSFRLSSKIDQERIAATVENGVLQVNLPLLEEKKPVTKQIEIQ
ncbi:MAG: Hsp20/alpha crystallin family protein [Marinifilaceae bacterium]